MKSGEKTKQQRIANRYFLIDSLESIIKESVYFRNHSGILLESNRVASLNIDAEEIRVEI